MAELYPDLKITEELRSYMAGKSDHVVMASAVGYLLAWVPRAAKDHAAECDLGAACKTCANFALVLSLVVAFTAEHPPIPGIPENLFDA